MAGIAVLFWFALRRSLFGFRLKAVGGNAVAARLAGLPVRRYKWFAFLLVSASAATAALLDFSYVASVAPDSGFTLLFPTFAAVIIGGASLQGGHGTVIGTLLGALLLAVIANGLAVIAAGAFAQQMLLGSVTIGAVVLDQVTQRWRASSMTCDGSALPPAWSSATARPLRPRRPRSRRPQRRDPRHRRTQRVRQEHDGRGARRGDAARRRRRRGRRRALDPDARAPRSLSCIRNRSSSPTSRWRRTLPPGESASSSDGPSLDEEERTLVERLRPDRCRRPTARCRCRCRTASASRSCAGSCRTPPWCCSTSPTRR